MQVRCPRCQNVIEAPPHLSRLTCSHCGYDDANPLFAAPVAAVPPPPAGFPGAPPPNAWPGMVSAEAKSAENMALIFGLISLVGGLMIGVPLLLGPVAIVYGNKANRLGAKGTPGVVMGWIAVALAILAFLVIIFIMLIVMSMANYAGIHQ